MAGIVLLLPLVFSRWSTPAIIYDFFFAQEHGWGVVAVAAAGGAGSADIDKLYQGKGEGIYIIIYTSYSCICGDGVRCAQEERLSGCI